MRLAFGGMAGIPKRASTPKQSLLETLDTFFKKAGGVGR